MASQLKRERAGVARAASSCNAFAIATFSSIRIFWCELATIVKHIRMKQSKAVYANSTCEHWPLATVTWRLFKRSLKTFLFHVYIALELSGRCALQIYLLTYLLTYSEAKIRPNVATFDPCKIGERMPLYFWRGVSRPVRMGLGD